MRYSCQFRSSPTWSAVGNSLAVPVLSSLKRANQLAYPRWAREKRVAPSSREAPAPSTTTTWGISAHSRSMNCPENGEGVLSRMVAWEVTRG